MNAGERAEAKRREAEASEVDNYYSDASTAYPPPPPQRSYDAFIPSYAPPMYTEAVGAPTATPPSYNNSPYPPTTSCCSPYPPTTNYCSPSPYPYPDPNLQPPVPTSYPLPTNYHQPRNPSQPLPPTYAEQTWGMEPGSDELDAPMKAHMGSALAFMTGSNTCRCGVCGRNVIWKDADLKFIKCPKCKVFTPRKGATPLDNAMTFVHCNGACKSLLIVPKSCTQFMCPRERKICQPLRGMH